jgi:hypothetical protein
VSTATAPPARRATVLWLALGIAAAGPGCATIDLGDNIVPPELMLDEEYFYCEIMPNCIVSHGCAGGRDASEAGMCHTARSALRLVDVTMPALPPPMCMDGAVIGGTVPTEYTTNFQNVQFTVQSDPLSSPFYRRPTMMDGHPVMVFGVDSACADLIETWINRGAM